MPFTPDISYIGETNHRRNYQRFGIYQPDRLLHTYIIGKTGTGKTTLIKNLLLQDIHKNRGCALLDVHGDLSVELYQLTKDNPNVIYIDATNTNCPYGYNILKNVSDSKKPLIASALLEVFEKLFGQKAWGARMEHVLRNTILTLLDQDGTKTLADIPRILLEKDFRRECIQNIKNEEVKNFWEQEYNKYPYPVRLQVIAPILNKTGAFLSNPTVTQFLINHERDLSLRKVIDEGKILLINLPKGVIGSDTSTLLGAVFLHALALAGFSRSDIPEQNRKSYFVYADEFQNFTTASIVDMLSELRKFKLGLTLSNQYFAQLNRDILDSVLGNVGTLISFRTGVEDARYLEREFYPYFQFKDIINLPNYHVYLKLMIDGTPSKPFSARTYLLR